MEIRDLFSPGDVDDDGNIVVAEVTHEEKLAILSRYGKPRGRMNPGTAAHEHVTRTGHYLSAGCCRDATEAPTVSTTPANDTRST